MMNAEKFVKQTYPFAYSKMMKNKVGKTVFGTYYLVFSNKKNHESSELIGRGETRTAAWTNARKKLPYHDGRTKNNSRRQNA